MQINDYDYVEPKGVNGRIFITSFPGLDEKGIFQELNFQTQLNILQKIIVVPLLLLWKIKNSINCAIKSNL